MQKQTEKLPLHSRTFSQHHICMYVCRYRTLTSIYSPLMPSSFTHWLVTSLDLRTYVCITDTLNKYTHFSSICRSVVKNSSTNTAQRKNEKQTNCCVCRKKHRLSHTEALHMQALDNCTPSSTYSMASIHLSDHRTTTIVLVLCYILLEPLYKGDPGEGVHLWWGQDLLSQLHRAQTSSEVYRRTPLYKEQLVRYVRFHSFTMTGKEFNDQDIVRTTALFHYECTQQCSSLTDVVRMSDVEVVEVPHVKKQFLSSIENMAAEQARQHDSFISLPLLLLYSQ